MRVPFVTWRAIGLGTLLVVLSGCSVTSQVIPVHGVVSRHGKPLAGVLVTFVPDTLLENQGTISSTITDQKGAYKLVYQGNVQVDGAAPGRYRIVIKDFAEENLRAETVPNEGRVPAIYTLIHTTPLHQDVSESLPRVDLKLD